MRRAHLAVTFVLLVVVGGTWSLGMPIFSAPDEPTHMRRAAEVARGQVFQRRQAPEAQRVALPPVLAHEPGCYAFKPWRDASCEVLDESGPPEVVGHTATAYPPLYHGAVGLAGRVHDGLEGLHLMRLASVALGAAMITLGVAAHARAGGPRGDTTLALLAVHACLTPMTLFLISVVNPSGLGIASAIAVWCWGSHLARRAPLTRLAVPAAATGVAMCTFLLLRRDSLLWGALIVAALLAVTPWSRLRSLVRARPVQVLAAAVAVAAVVQLGWSGSQAGSFIESAEPTSVGGLDWARAELDRVHSQMIGVLGWVDAQLPPYVHRVFGAVLVGLAALAAWRGSRRVTVVMAGVVGVVVAATLAFGVVRPYYVQGRYLLPFAVGVPLLAGAALAESRWSPTRQRWALAVPFGLLASAQVLAFHVAMRRFAVGTEGPWWFYGEPGWQPPVAAAVLLAVNAAATAGLAAHLFRSGRPVPSRG